MFTLLTLRIDRRLALTATLLLGACSGDPPAAIPSDDEDESSTESPATSGDDSPSTDDDKGPSAGMSGTGRPVTDKPMNAGTKPPTGSGDAGSLVTDVDMNGLDGSTSNTTEENASTSSRPPATSFSFPTMLEPHISDQPIFNITRPTDLTKPGGLLPVIVWANGGCFRSDFTWSPLFQRWAAAGFVVLSLSAKEGDLFAALGQTTKTEHAKLIDWVVAQDKSGPYAGKLDLERIVVAGNSCGGVTALEVAAMDKRLAAVFVLSGSSAVGSVNKKVMEAISIPVGYVVGGAEDIAGANAQGDYDAMKEGVPAMIVSRREGDHQTVSTDEKILPEDAEIALNWMDLALYGTKEAYTALTSPNVCDKCTPGDWKLKSKNLEKLQK